MQKSSLFVTFAGEDNSYCWVPYRPSVPKKDAPTGEPKPNNDMVGTAPKKLKPAAILKSKTIRMTSAKGWTAAGANRALVLALPAQRPR